MVMNVITIMAVVLGIVSIWLVFAVLVDDEDQQKEDWCDGNSRSRREKE